MKRFLFIICLILSIVPSNAQVQVWANPESYQIRQIVTTNNKIFYFVNNNILFCTTGNENSGVRLADFSETSQLTVWGNKVVFLGRNDYDFGVWISDGTIAGTFKLAPCNSEVHFAILNDKLYFTNANSIYSSDGTTSGTTKLLTAPPIDQNYEPVIISLTALQDKLIYNFYGQLGVTDGISSTVEFLSDNTAALISRAYITNAVVNNKLIFINYTSSQGQELWSTDGTNENTGLLIELNPGSGDGFETVDQSLHPWFTASNGKLYFVGSNGTRTSVWVTDGTEAGTNELYKGAPYGGNPVSLKSIDGNIYYSNNYSYGFYFSDGLNNTVQNIAGTQNAYDAYSFTKFNDSIYFVAYDADHGYELWKTGNTAESTTRVLDLCAGSGSAINHFTGLIACNDILFFSGSNVGYGTDDYGNPSYPNYQLWKITDNSISTSTQTAKMQALKYYPNPCQDYLSIELQETAFSVRCVSASGIIIQPNWTNENNTIYIQTEHLHAGMYKLLIDGYAPISIIKE